MSYFGDPLSDKWEFSPCFESGLKRPYEKYTIWHVTPNDYDNNYGINTGGRRKEIATVRGVGGSMTTTKAVARRMASAPDMLEALKVAENALADAFNYAKLNGSTKEATHYNEAFFKVVSAIEKAKGGQ